jgi:hypothetical protein
MADHAAGVDSERALVEGAQVVPVGLPAPVEPGHDRVGGDVLDRLHHPGQVALLAGADRGEGDAAVAQHHGGDAVPARRAGHRVPEELGVEVGVDVDEAGRDQAVTGVHLAPAPLGHLAHRGDPVAVDGHVGRPRRGPGAVGDLAPADHDVVHRRTLPPPRVPKMGPL